MSSNSQDLFGLYFSLYEETEPPTIFHRWSLVTCLSAYLGRNFWFPFGSQRIFPNFYTMFIGLPASRKSTAIKLGKKLFSLAGYTTFAAEKTSKEKFLLDLEGKEMEEELKYSKRTPSMGKGKRSSLSQKELEDLIFGTEKEDERGEPREVFIVADEFNEFAGSGNLDFLSLLGALWDWDDENLNYSYRLKNSKSVSIYQPTISILAGNTHAGFNAAFPPEAIGQGFLSRLILVYSDPSGKKIPFPPDPDEELRAGIVEYLHQIKSTVVGPAELSRDAREALSLIYRSWKELKDYRFKNYSGRRYTHLIKLCLVVAAARCSKKIEEQDVVYANTMLTYVERDMPKALGEFGKSRDGDIANKIMQLLYDAREPVPSNELWKQVRNDIDKGAQLIEIMQKLVNSGQAIHVKEKGYLPKKEILNHQQIYVNFEMLLEYRMQMGLPITKAKLFKDHTQAQAGNVQQLPVRRAM